MKLSATPRAFTGKTTSSPSPETAAEAALKSLQLPAEVPPVPAKMEDKFLAASRKCH